MTDLATLTNHQIRLAARPVGLPHARQLVVHHRAGGGTSPGGIVVKTLSSRSTRPCAAG